MQDPESGFTLVINGVSSLNKELSNTIRQLRTELDKEKSEKSVLLARNKYLEKHVDQEVIRKLTTMVDNEVRLKTWVADKKK